MDATRSILSGLVADIAMRDGDALARLVDICLPRVYGLALRITRSPLLAENVAQDVFVDVWSMAAAQVRGTESPLAWLARLCRGHALELLRNHPAGASAPPAAGGAADLQDLLAATRRGASFDEAVRALDHRQREMLRLAFFEGLGLGALSTRLALPVGIVEARLNGALSILKGDAARAAAA
jgi:RNA polymerase sigma-70 factor (ECF subfamily)